MHHPAFLSPNPLATKSFFSSSRPTTSCSRPSLNTAQTLRAVAEPTLAAPTTESFDKYVMQTYSRYPLTMSHGRGAMLYTVDNTPYIDCVAGIATCTLGHAHPAIVQAVSEQIRKINHVSNLYYIPQQGQLAEWLVKQSGMHRAFFCNSGAEANEAAIKLARKVWHKKHGSCADDKPVILSARNSFHGRTLGALSATGQEKYQKEYWPLVEGFEYFEYNDEEDLKRVANNVGDRLAGIMLEAIQGEGGVNVGRKEFFATVKKVCEELDALLICDEVQVGVGRTGSMWGFEQMDIIPDVFTTAKGLGGGVPIGAMICSEKADVFGPGDHASTFGGNPLACAAGMATIKELMGGVLQNCRERGKEVEEGLIRIMERVKCVKEIRGRGLIWGVQVEGVKAAEVVAKCLEKGVLLVPAGPDVVRIVPPLVIEREEVQEVLVRLEQALNELVKEKGL